MRALAGKVALITGAGRGIGRAIALAFAREGANVALNFHRNTEAADEVRHEAERLGVRAVAIRADVSKVDEIESLFDSAEVAFGRLDIAVVNAGIEKVNIPVTEISETDFDELFRVNTKGPFFVMREAARRVTDGGRIINIASSTTSRPQPGLGLYGTSKSAPKYLARVLALELGSRRITVNSILPGPVRGAGIFADVPPDDPYVASLLQTVPSGRFATP